MGVTVCLTLGLLGFLLAQNSAVRSVNRVYWMRLAWAAMGVGIPEQRLIGLLLPAAAMAAMRVSKRDLSFLKRLDLRTGPVILLTDRAAWIVRRIHRQSRIPAFLFHSRHFQRFLTQSHHRLAPGGISYRSCSPACCLDNNVWDKR
jgi:4-amino-4-deoxy-L-arabinose transferase-like glycosyltransferase